MREGLEWCASVTERAENGAVLIGRYSLTSPAAAVPRRQLAEGLVGPQRSLLIVLVRCVLGDISLPSLFTQNSRASAFALPRGLRPRIVSRAFVAPVVFRHPGQFAHDHARYVLLINASRGRLFSVANWIPEAFQRSARHGPSKLCSLIWLVGRIGLSDTPS